LLPDPHLSPFSFPLPPVSGILTTVKQAALFAKALPMMRRLRPNLSEKEVRQLVAELVQWSTSPD